MIEVLWIFEVNEKWFNTKNYIGVECRENEEKARMDGVRRSMFSKDLTEHDAEQSLFGVKENYCYTKTPIKCIMIIIIMYFISSAIE